MHLSPDLQASVTKRRKVSLDDCLPCASHEAQRSTPVSTLHSSSASTSRKRMSNSKEVDAESGGTASSKRRCHRGIRSAAARECNYMSAHNRHCSISATTLFSEQSFKILFYNVQGLISHAAELAALIRILRAQPALICLNETFLDTSTGEVPLEGYRVVARRDRKDGRKCGGVAVYALDSIHSRVTMVEESATNERVWLVLHADTGPYLVGVWYRPPDPGETASIDSCEEEWQRLSVDVLGTIFL